LKFLTILLILTIFMNCAQSSSHSRRPVSSVQCVPKKKSYQVGEELKINFETKLKEGTVEKIEIFIDGKVVMTSKNLTNSLVYKTGEYGVGKHIIKISCSRTDGVTGDNYDEILVTSDIKPAQYSYEVVAVFPHDTRHFTQGLEFHENMLYEGTGQEGSSAIYRINLKNGSVEKQLKLENQYFGEGITILNNKIFQLTYKHQLGFVYDLNTFETIKTFKYKSKEGWGLTNDGQNLIMSDGTENIIFINPDTFSEIKRIQVTNEHNVVNSINELELIKGEIWANIWMTDTILIIDPKTGKVTGEINLSGLSGTILQNQKEPVDVLNGIAWNPLTDKIYVTGKWWPKLYEIKLKKI
jgi:glutaminyl-peptide cyclotransferase